MVNMKIGNDAFSKIKSLVWDATVGEGECADEPDDKFFAELATHLARPLTSEDMHYARECWHWCRDSLLNPLSYHLHRSPKD